MKRQKANVIDIGQFRAPTSMNHVIGCLVDITDEGIFVVDYPGNVHGPLHARFISDFARIEQKTSAKGMPVLLVFENADACYPIIVGFVQDRITRDKIIEFEIPDQTQQKNFYLDKKKVVLEAREQIELRCGKSSLTLTKEGKIIVKGMEIVSRAVKANKIKGASVSIN